MNLKRRAVVFGFPALLVAAAAYFIISLWPPAADEKDLPKIPTVARKVRTVKLPPVIVVEATFPGGDSWTVANTVGGPIEQGLRDLEKVADMTSSASSHRFILHITFEDGVNLDKAVLKVLERVNRTQAFLPPHVRASVRIQSPFGPMLVAVISPDGNRDDVFLSAYATKVVQQELSALAGVSEVACYGTSEQNIRVLLDKDKLAARKLSAKDVVQAFSAMNQPVGGGFHMRADDKLIIRDPPKDPAKGPAPPFANVSEVEDVILFKSKDNQPIRVKDLAQVELTARHQDSWALLNGKHAVLLALRVRHDARPDDVREAVKNTLARLRHMQPDGLDVKLAFDLSHVEEAPSFRALDLMLPPGQSVEATAKTCEVYMQDIKRFDGVGDVLAFADIDTHSNQACILIGLAGSAATRENSARDVRQNSHALMAAGRARWHNASLPMGFPRYYFLHEMAIVGPKDDKVREFAVAFVKRLEKSDKVTARADLTLVPRDEIQIDRAAATEFGVDVPAIVNRYGLSAGFSILNTKYFVIDFARTGRGMSVVVQVELPRHGNVVDGKDLDITNDKGEKIPLSKVAKFNMYPSPAAVDKLNSEPMVRITVEPASGVSFAEVSKLCEALAEEVRNELRLPLAYRLTWLR